MVDISEHNESDLVPYVVVDDDDDDGNKNVTTSNAMSFISLTTSPRVTDTSQGPSSHSITVLR